MDPAHRPLPLDSLVAQSLEKLNEVESGLRHIILFAFDPTLSHSPIEADAFIRRAIWALKKALPTRE
ncbi:MAG: hypothetical protein WCC21_18345 [Candidatus Acidiferrales bacterium]